MTTAGFPHSDTPGSQLGWQLPGDYRGLPRPSSVPGAKASTVRPYTLTHTRKMLASTMQFSTNNQSPTPPPQPLQRRARPGNHTEGTTPPTNQPTRSTQVSRSAGQLTRRPVTQPTSQTASRPGDQPGGRPAGRPIPSQPNSAPDTTQTPGHVPHTNPHTHTCGCLPPHPHAPA